MDGCEAGCSHFTCGSIGHHKDCQHYPDSMQQMIDDKNATIEAVKALLNGFDTITDSGAAMMWDDERKTLLQKL